MRHYANNCTFLLYNEIIKSKVKKNLNLKKKKY